jgi:hypothetical protein
VASSCVCLMSAAPGGRTKALVDGVIIFVDEVEQASDLGDGESDQAAGSAWALRWTLRLLRWVRVVRVCGLSTGEGPLFSICVASRRGRPWRASRG